jgi:triosephosphate isomerase
MRTPLVVGNWKMHGGVARARELGQALREGLKRPRGVHVAVCPPFTAIPAVVETLAGSPIAVGAQNCHWADEGAFTGEVSPAMLAELGCRFVILGHSERRQVFRESDDEVNRKTVAALRHGLVPIVCVGETADERRQGLTFTVVEGQLRGGLAGVTTADLGRCVLAYEPVWAIGTGVTATPAQAAEVHGYLRGLVGELASKEVAQALRILYGGSVKPDNVTGLSEESEIDGALVGGASLEAAAFIAIVKRSAARGGSKE